MYRITYLLVFILLPFTNSLDAQSFTTGIIKGRVIDVNKAPVSQAIVLLKNETDTLYKTGSTNNNGSFNFIEIPEGRYVIELSSVGFENIKIPNLVISKTDSVIDLAPVILTMAPKILQGVTIRARPSLIEKQIDKTVVNVDQSIASNGTTALELMQKLPGVQMTTDGQITLNGKSGVNVLMDGKSTYLSTEDLANLLGSTPSSEIQRIEIMTNPSARYDAAGTGGIINILKKKSHKNGFNGSMNGSLGQAYYGRYNGGLAANYKNNHFNLFLTSNYTANKTLLDRDVTTDILTGSTLLNEQTSQNRDAITSKSYNTTFGADFYLSKKNTITFSGNISTRKGADETNSIMNILDGSVNKINSEIFTASNIDKPLNYTAGIQCLHQLDTSGRQLLFDADYSNYKYRPKQYNRTKLNDAAGNLINQTDAILDEYRRLDIYGIRLDYVQPLSSIGKFEVGLKSSYVKTNNNNTYYNQTGGQNIFDSAQSDYSLNTENINAAYVNLNKKYDKLTIQAGLRGEQTANSGKQEITRESVSQNYFQLFPTLFADYKINDRNSLNFQFGRRTDRADYHELVPFRRPLTPTLYFEGNPNLQPQLSWHTEATWAYQNAIFINFGYDIYWDYVRTLPFLDTNKTTATRTPINIQGAHSWNFNISYNKQLTPWWATNNTASIYQTSFNGEVKGFSLRSSGIPSVEIELNESFIINSQLSAETNFEYDSKRQFVSSTYGAYSILSFGVKHQLFHKKGSLSLNAHNVLQSEGRSGTDRYENLNQHSYGYSHSRAVIITFNYRFGNGKLTKTQIKSGAAEEQQRAGN